MKVPAIIALIFLSLLSYGQKTGGRLLIDSLLTEIARRNDDTLKIREIYDVAREYAAIDPNESKKYAGVGLLLANRLQNKEALVKFHICIGRSSLMSGDLSEALKSFYAALQLKDNINKKQEATCYENIGNVYNDMNEYGEALKNYNLALNIARQSGDKHQIAFSLENICCVYNLQHCNDSDALKIAQEGLSIFEEIDDKFGIASARDNIGNIYSSLRNYPEALKNLFAAEKMYEEVGEQYQLAGAYGAIGCIFLNQDKYGEAKIYFNKAIESGKQIGALPVIENAQRSLTDVYARTGNYKRAFETYKAYIATRDSVVNEANTKKIVRQQMQFDFDKKEADAAVKQARRDAQAAIKLQQKNVAIYGSFCALAVLLVISSLLARQYKLKADHQKADLEQKQLRAQMNPHFIFNCLNSIQQFIIINDVKNANKYLTGFAMLMRQTLENSKAGIITLQKEIAYITNYLSLESIRFKDDFIYEINCASNINSGVEIPAMIIQPLIENAIRHGLCYLEERKGRLLVSFYLKEKSLYCEIDDNGIGRDKSHKLKMNSETVYESQGMELTKLRLALASKDKNANYEISVTDKKNTAGEPEGTTVTIKFPIDT